MTGVKYDKDKPIAGTVIQDFSQALLAVSLVGTFGAKKYAKSNWINVENGIERYTDAMMRHFLSETHQMYDADSGISDAAHTAWNALARLELMLRNGYKLTEQDSDEIFQRFNSGTRAGTSGQVSKAVYDTPEQRVRDSKEDLDEDTISQAG